MHLERNAKLIKILVDEISNKEFKESDYKYGYGVFYISLENTKEKISEHVWFD